MRLISTFARGLAALAFVLATIILATMSLATGASAQQSTWDAIKERGTLRMGVTQAPPWYSKNPATGEWDSGLIVTIGQNMAETLKVKLDTVEVTWATAIAALQANKIDFMFLDATPSRAMVAAAVAFLASDEAAFITGAILAVDGGSLAMGR